MCLEFDLMLIKRTNIRIFVRLEKVRSLHFEYSFQPYTYYSKANPDMQYNKMPISRNNKFTFVISTDGHIIQLWEVTFLRQDTRAVPLIY